LALQRKSGSTQVLVDYKNISSPEVKPTAAKRPDRGVQVSDGNTAGDANPRQSGNGRIRKVLALCSIAVVGTVLIDKVIYKSAAPALQPLTTNAVKPEASAAPNKETAALGLTIKTTQPPEPEFVFNQDAAIAANPADSGNEVPFYEVSDIDSLIDPSDVPVAAVTNPAPLTAARPEHANDYSQEPSQILVRIEKGDSLFGVLTKHGLDQQEIATLTNKPLVGKYLTNLRPGDEIELDFDGSHRLTRLTREIDLEKTLYITRAADNQFNTVLDEQPFEKQIQVAEVKLDSSLSVDGAEAGLSESMIMELYSIFQWTVDFNREVRIGDQVTVLYESFIKKGKKVKNGNILAAEYRASDATYSAFRHVRSGQRTYFDADGQSLKKQFLRNPIKARITSRFNPARKHPILNTIRPHKGVDYGAPTGTSISATGDGRVVFMGTKGTYGKAVEIQHSDRYTTLYAHLSRFPKKLKNGSRVSQGQIIGYVGQTGTATGPNLHYEFRVDGLHYDPQKAKLPGSSPLEKSELIAFKQNIEPLRAQLASLRADSETLAMR